MTVTISSISTTKPGQHQALLHLQAEVAAHQALDGHDEDVAAVEHRDRQQVQQAEVQAEHRHEREEREPAGRGRVARHLRDRDGPHQLARGRLARDQASERLHDRARRTATLRSTLIFIAPSRSGCTVRNGSWMPMPIRPMSPCRRGVTVTSSGAPARCTRQRDRLFGVLPDLSRQLARKHDRLAVERQDDVVDLQAGLVGGPVGLEAADARVHLGQHADVADAHLRLRFGLHRNDGLAPLAQQRDRHVPLGAAADGQEEVLPGGRPLAADLDDAVARLDAALLRRRSLRHDRDVDRVALEDRSPARPARAPPSSAPATGRCS